MLGSNGFGAIISAIWAVVLMAFAVVAAAILCVLGGWKLSEIIWAKIKKKLVFKNA